MLRVFRLVASPTDYSGGISGDDPHATFSNFFKERADYQPHYDHRTLGVVCQVKSAHRKFFYHIPYETSNVSYTTNIPSTAAVPGVPPFVDILR